jgi:hypothetical protein
MYISAPVSAVSWSRALVTIFPDFFPGHFATTSYGLVDLIWHLGYIKGFSTTKLQHGVEERGLLMVCFRGGEDPSENGRGKDSPNLLDELVFWQRSLEELDLVALGLEDIPSRLVHVLEKQDLDVLGVEGLELLGRSGPVSEGAGHEAALT